AVKKTCAHRWCPPVVWMVSGYRKGRGISIHRMMQNRFVHTKRGRCAAAPGRLFVIDDFADGGERQTVAVCQLLHGCAFPIGPADLPVAAFQLLAVAGHLAPALGL